MKDNLLTACMSVWALACSLWPMERYATSLGRHNILRQVVREVCFGHDCLEHCRGSGLSNAIADIQCMRDNHHTSFG